MAPFQFDFLACRPRSPRIQLTVIVADWKCARTRLWNLAGSNGLLFEWNHGTASFSRIFARRHMHWSKWCHLWLVWSNMGRLSNCVQARLYCWQSSSYVIFKSLPLDFLQNVAFFPELEGRCAGFLQMSLTTAVLIGFTLIPWVNAFAHVSSPNLYFDTRTLRKIFLTLSLLYSCCTHP